MSDYLTHTERYPANWGAIIQTIRGIIEGELSEDPTFGGVTFCDVSAGYIQLNMIHADETGYVHRIHRLEYDMSNAEAVLQEAIAMWQATPQKAPSSFYREGEKWGWD